MTHTDAESSGVQTLGDADMETVLAENPVVLAEFAADWCGSCRQMEPILASLAADADAAVLVVDVETNLETAIEYGAQSAPTFVLFVDGRPVKTLRGAQDEATLRALLDRYRAVEDPA
jgi:thioredoxin 1